MTSSFQSTQLTDFPCWENLCRRIGTPPPAAVEASYMKLLDTYHSTPRFYHNLEHVSSCLKELEILRTCCFVPLAAGLSCAVEFALWWHDAVYDTKSHTNEEDSAGLALGILSVIKAPAVLVPTVKSLILATKHNRPFEGVAEQLIQDVDLSILGQHPRVFDQYEEGIRKEYSHVSDHDFNSGRLAFLEQFMARPRLYSTDYYFQRSESAARWNLERSILALRLKV